MTTQETQHQKTADQRIPDTEVIAVATPAPVFVDSTGRRSRMLRRIALGFGILVVSYGGLVSVSLAGGPVSSSAVLPLPGMDDDEKADPAPPRPNPAPAVNPTSAPATAPPVESTVNPARPAARPTVTVTAKPAATTKPVPAKATTPPATKAPTTKPTPTPAVTTTKPTESTTTTPAADPTTTKPADPVVAPAPPAPPVSTGTTKIQPEASGPLGDDPADTGSPAPSSSGEPA
ncbi:hypothetical protein [Actinoplanes sp. HUAS TT8]|uniref:hypothetical protein n=1 Tax=Actinoplanes sp. HUAS TT8 TaxID=3447453 RepID=UPI003F51B8D5